MENKSEIEHFSSGLVLFIQQLIFFFSFIQVIFVLFSVNTELAKRKWNFHGLHSMQMDRE